MGFQPADGAHTELRLTKPSAQDVRYPPILPTPRCHRHHPPSPRRKIHLRRFITSSIWLIRHYLRFAPPVLCPLSASFPQSSRAFFFFFLVSNLFRSIFPPPCRAAPRHPSPFILALLLHSLMKSGPRRRPHSATVFLDTPTIYHFVRETLKVSRALIRARGGTMGAIREAEHRPLCIFSSTCRCVTAAANAAC